MDDFSLIQKVLEGDRDAYAEIVRQHQARVLRLCTSFLNNAADAEDAAQEVFVKAYQSLSKFQRDSAFYTWLYRIASNHCLELLRARKRRPTESWEALLESQGDRIQELFSSSADPRRSLEAARLVDRILSGLKHNYRQILILRESEGLSYEEIAQVMGCSLDSVKAQLRRARQELEEKLRHFRDKSNI